MRIAPLALMLIAAPAAAADKPKQAPPAVVQKLLDCRALTDSAVRLACLDAGVAALAGAVENRDVLVADKEEVKKARRGLFGADKDEVAEGEKKDERGALTEIEATITAARPSRTAGWRFVLDDGSTWLQTDAIGFRRDPKPGMKIRIRRAAMGSYLANVEGQLAVRVKRVVE
jgi:hypothetical protein